MNRCSYLHVPCNCFDYLDCLHLHVLCKISCTLELCENQFCGKSEVPEWPFHSKLFNKLKKNTRHKNIIFSQVGDLVLQPLYRKKTSTAIYIKTIKTNKTKIKNNKNKTAATTMVATQRNMARRITKWVKTDLRSTGQHVVGHALVGYRKIWWKNGKNTFYRICWLDGVRMDDGGDFSFLG